MASLFGKKKAKPKAPSAAETAGVITELRGKLDILEKRQDHVQKKIDQQLLQARQKSKAKDKRGALMCLKRKKLYEKEIAKYSGAMLTLEQQIMALESAATNTVIIDGMRTANSMMGRMHAELTPEKVDDVLEDVAEQVAMSDEIGEALATPVGGMDLMEDDDILAELNELEEQEAEKTFLSAPVAPVAAGGVAAATPAAAEPAPSYALPSAPSGAVAIAAAPAEDDEMRRELAALEAEMGM